MAVMVALVVLPAGARGEHSKLSLDSIGPAGGNGGAPADLVGPADIGSRVFISTAEGLTAADTDSSLDLYSRTGGNTALLSAGNPGGNGAFPATYGRARASGTRVFFQTDERLSTADTDNSLDVYMRDGSTTTLISTGPGSGSFGPYDSYFAAASTDGTRVFFTTRGALVGADNDQALDVYERAGGTTTLVSTGGSGQHSVDLAAITDDGSKVFLHTEDSLVAADTDDEQDVYQRSGGVTTLVSTGPSAGNPSDAFFAGMSEDGSKVFFQTGEQLVSADTDAATDVYERSGGTTTIHSVSPSGGNAQVPATFAGASADGSTVFVESVEKLLAAPVDTDSFNDVYVSSGGTLTHLTGGGNDNFATNAYFLDASADGSRVFFRSEEALVAGDTDKYQDIYQHSGGTLTRLSLGPNGGNGAAHAFFGGASEDGTHVYFQTHESLDSSDTDTNTDVYERHAGATYHLSAGADGGNGAFDATFRAVSADGRRVFFRTAESLLPADSDSAIDLYSANVPGTVTIRLDAVPDNPQDFDFQAFGLDDGFAFSPPDFGPTEFTLDDDAGPPLSNEQTFTGVTPGVGYSVSQTAVQGWNLTSATCDDGSPVTAIDVSAGEHVTCTFTNQLQSQPGYARPRGATPARFSLVPAYRECTQPNREHGPPLDHPSCHPPPRESSLLTVGTPDANGVGANSSGFAKWDVIVGNPGTPADEADVRLIVNVTDVRLAAGLDDYTGELAGEVSLRITDRDASVPATVQDLPLAVAVPCAATASTSVGATCVLTTTVDAITPGAVQEGDRAIWELAQLQLNDGGSDGAAATQPNSPFVRQGIFVP